MSIIPFLKRHYVTNFPLEEIKIRVERNTTKPDHFFSFQKAAKHRVLEGKTTKNGFVIVMGKYGLTFGKTSLLPFAIGRLTSLTETKTRIDITIQPSLGGGLVIISCVYILAATGIYFSWLNGQVQGILVPSILIIVTYGWMLYKFNKEKKVYLKFIEDNLLQN